MSIIYYIGCFVFGILSGEGINRNIISYFGVGLIFITWTVVCYMMGII